MSAVDILNSKRKNSFSGGKSLQYKKIQHRTADTLEHASGAVISLPFSLKKVHHETRESLK